jgi:hypothetical protein
MEHKAGCELREKISDQCTCVEDSCGCAFCDLDLEIYEQDTGPFHKAKDGQWTPCTASRI